MQIQISIGWKNPVGNLHSSLSAAIPHAMQFLVLLVVFFASIALYWFPFFFFFEVFVLKEGKKMERFSPPFFLRVTTGEFPLFVRKALKSLDTLQKEQGGEMFNKPEITENAHFFRLARLN
ncbi:hypothetical protein CEXT_563121 [Caerostris extrusa]|uniref:Uncharacterized protein n=1 Tax=Caerostris extrusa TaxID=172846 RepID=A0AAV4WEC6_CAEEX|nr:hypothetical protein CEXT_563121 [Caerostris extrusa]